MNDTPDERPTKANVSKRSSWGLNTGRLDTDDESTKLSTEATRTRQRKSALDGESATVGHAGSGTHDDDERTHILRPTTGGPDLSRAPVGWLVVVAGPGLGQSFALSHGSNRIGRGDGIEVSLNFGDNGISRGAHARITYDTKGRAFYVQPGEGTGLTYRDGQPVLTPQVLTASAQVEIGQTTLRFVPLCGPDFDWQDLASASGAAK